VASLLAVQPLHVAAWIEAMARELSPPRVKQQLAAVLRLFERLVPGQIETASGNHSFRATGITTYLQKWRHAGNGRDDGEPQPDPHHPALRSQAR
tara:strand:- start:10659 stop:10943 length:285 start_codon:yes stop_codon:yes gene_type:complete